MARLDQEKTVNSNDQLALQKFKDTIESFTQKVDNSHFDFLKHGKSKPDPPRTSKK
jgi:hypothetical protein